jgi:hypothetical protein
VAFGVVGEVVGDGVGVARWDSGDVPNGVVGVAVDAVVGSGEGEGGLDGPVLLPAVAVAVVKLVTKNGIRSNKSKTLWLGRSTKRLEHEVCSRRGKQTTVLRPT